MALSETIGKGGLSKCFNEGLTERRRESYLPSSSSILSVAAASLE
jgi:hypothetical protein